MGMYTRRAAMAQGMWSALIALTLVLLPGMAATTATAANAPPEATAALQWLRSQQHADGGFPGFSGPDSDPGDSADAAFAFLAAGVSLDSVKNGDANTSLLDYLRATADSAKPGVAAKYLLIVASPGVPAASFGAGLAARALSEQDGTTGVYGGSYFIHALVVLAAAATVSPDTAQKIDNGVLLKAQHPDGGWSFDGKMTSDTNTTALAVQALVASGQGGDATTRALAYLEGTRMPDDLYPYDTNADAGDADSTAYVIQAKIAAQSAPAEIARATAALRMLQGPNGALQFQPTVPGDNFLATVQAVPALAGRAFPLIGA